MSLFRGCHFYSQHARFYGRKFRKQIFSYCINDRISRLYFPVDQQYVDLRDRVALLPISSKAVHVLIGHERITDLQERHPFLRRWCCVHLQPDSTSIALSYATSPFTGNIFIRKARDGLTKTLIF